MKDTLVLISILVFALRLCGQDVVINEFMAKNSITIEDEDEEFSDWIELYNADDIPVDLSGFSLSDDINELNKWVFPDMLLSPKSYLLIFASGKDRHDTTELHTNFKISSGGEELFFTNSLGVIIDQVEAVELSSDESYSRFPDGGSDWIVTGNSSPGTTNNYSNQLLFSDQEGFYSNTFTLSINSVTGDTVYYTLDGDLPTIYSNYCDGSLLIEDRTSDPNVFSEIPTTPDESLIDYKEWESPKVLLDKATILRCASYRNGVRTSKIYTKTYFVGDQLADKYTLPVISLISEEEHFFSENDGLYVPGVNFDFEDTQWSGNYFMRGEDWEREVHIEYFDQNGMLGFSQDAGVRIHGGKSRQAAQKTLRLYAREEYGKKNFDYKLLPNRDVDKYDRFLLRTSMGAWERKSVIKDVLIQNICSTLDLEYQEFQPAIVFLNGEYWGVHTIRDRIDERYLSYVSGVDRDSLELRGWGNPDYDALIDFIEENSLAEESNYEYVKTKIDINNYLDYTIAELFFKNFDWPSNNMKLWRTLPDGKWRWILYDLDAGMGNYSYNMMEHATKNDPSISWPNPPWATFLFRSLLENESFKSAFLSRYIALLNNEFAQDRMLHKLDSIKNIYSPEMQGHIDRWNYPDSYANWEEDIEVGLLDFIEYRACFVREYLMSFFNLTEFDFVCDKDKENPALSDEIIIAPNPTDGNIFISNYSSELLNATITITNIMGQKVYEESNVNLLENERKYLDISDFMPNVYLLQISSGDYSLGKRIVKSN